MRNSEKNSVILAKYLSTHTNRLTTSILSVSYIKNSRAVDTVAEKNPTIIEDYNFHFNDYLNDSDNENKDQSTSSNDHKSSS